MSKLLDYTGLGRFLDKLKTLFVTDIGVNGNSLTYTKDGLTNEISVKTINNVSLLGSGDISTTTVYGLRGTLFSPIAKGNIYNRSVLFQYSEHELIGSATSYTNTDSKELTTLDFDPFGTIAYANNLSASDGDTLNSSNIYYQVNVDLRYGFKIASNPLVPGKIVYIKCEPLVDGSNNRTGRVKLATDQPIVQDLPSTADGFVYIQLGWAISETNIFVIISHPIYEFKNGALRLWTNSEDFSDKADKDTLATLGNIAVFNSSGNPVDGGKSIQSMGNGILYGTIDKTLSSTNNLVVNVDGLSELTPGTTIYILNKEVYSSSTCTMNVNNLGALPIYETDNSLVRVGFTNGTAFMFIYNPTRVEGGCWDKQSGKFLYFNLGYFSRSIAALLIAKADFTGPTLTVHYSTTELLPLFTNKIATTTDFDPFSNIYWWYYGSCLLGDVVTPTSLYTRYEFTGFGLDSYPLTKNKQFFLRCEPITVNGIRNGRVRLASEPFAQDLPNTEDGFVYILIGLRNNGTTGGWLSHIHPIYEYKDGALRLWTNAKENNDFIVTATLLNSVITSDKTISEIIEAKEAGKNVWLDASSIYQGESKYPLNVAADVYGGLVTFTKVSWVFGGSSLATVSTFVLTGTTLTHSSYTIENTSNKVTSLSSSSTDTQYPSAKCIYDLSSLKLDKIPIVSVASNASSLSCEEDKYYRLDTAVNKFSITLPAVTDVGIAKSIIIYLTTGATPAITITSTQQLHYSYGFSLKASKTYEINALWNGAAWTITNIEL